MNFNLLTSYLLGFIILCILIKIFYAPFRVFVKLCFNTMLGGIILFLINISSSFTGIFIGVNVFTALITGILGIPGVATMLMMQIMFVV